MYLNPGGERNDNLISIEFNDIIHRREIGNYQGYFSNIKNSNHLEIVLFNNIKAKIPNAVLRTTVMVGFPGETKQDFDNLLKFIEEVKFDHLGGFTYSKEEGTKSYDFPHQVRQATKQKRLDELMALQQKISYDLNKRHIGEIMNGLVVGKENGYYLLRSYWNAPDDVDGKILFSSSEELKEGDIVNVKIKESYVYDLYGEIVK